MKFLPSVHVIILVCHYHCYHCSSCGVQCVLKEATAQSADGQKVKLSINYDCIVFDLGLRDVFA